MSNTALLLLDLQRDFLEVDGRMPISLDTADLVLASVRRLLERAERLGWKLLVISSEFDRKDRLGNFFRKGAAVRGSAGAEIDPRLGIPSTAIVVSKMKADAFTNPLLERVLRDNSIDRLVVCGVMAEGCVRATTKSAIARGFSVVVVPDAIGSSGTFLKWFGLRSMQKAGAELKKCSKI